MNEEEELAHLHAPSADPKQRQIDYWGRRAERAEAEVERLQAECDEWRSCANYDVLMEGPRFQQWNMSLLNRCRRRFIENACAALTGGKDG